MQMLDTVDWTGDGDDTDFFLAIERIFDLRLRSHLPWTNFGEVRDHVIAHVSANGRRGTACATQMTFYRLRRALQLGRNVGPDASLPTLIVENPHRSFRDLEADTGLKMPQTRVGWAGAVGLMCFAIAVAVLAFTTWSPLVRILVAVASAYAGLWLRHFDCRRMPHGCETMGDLARLVTDQNLGRLARDGARLSDADIWQIIQQLAASESRGDPELIGPQTTFFRSKVKAA
jgi:hypothetical protein